MNMNNTKSKLDLKKLQKKFDEILESMSDEDLLKYIERGKKIR